jgi:hypothetical protein
VAGGGAIDMEVRRLVDAVWMQPLIVLSHQRLPYLLCTSARRDVALASTSVIDGC